MKREFEFIEKRLRSSIGGGQSSSLIVAITPFRKQGTTQAEVRLEIVKRFDVKDIEKANELYEAIQKFSFDLDRIVKRGKL